jgi:hypothetical protein
MTIHKTIFLGALVGMLMSASQTPALLSSPALQGLEGAVTPRLHVDRGGPLYLLWKEARDGRASQIRFSRSTDLGQQWAAEALRLDPEAPSGARSSGPRLASDGHGYVYTAWWTKQRDGAKAIFVSTSRDFGASFAPPVQVNRDAGAFPPELSADSQGHVYVVWADERAQDGEGLRPGREAGTRLYFTRSDDHGATWLPQDVQLGGETVGRGRVMQAWPQVRSDDRGHVYVSWFDTRDGGAHIYFRASDDSGRTWREEVRVKGGQGDVEGPMQFVATAPGHLYLAWADNRDGEYGIYLVASTDHGRTWSKEVRLDVGKAKIARASLPSLAADAAGRVYVAWQDARHGGWDVYFNMSSDCGRTWLAEEVRLNTGAPGEAEARLPQLALDGQGRLAVAWQEDRGVAQQEGVYLRWSTDAGRTWQAPDQRVDEPQPGTAAGKPQLVLRPDGAAVIVWEVTRPERQDLGLTVVAPGGRQMTAR